MADLPCEKQPDLRTAANRYSAVGNPCAMASVPEDQRWVFDPETWELAPGSESIQDRVCYIYGSKGKVKLPTLTWETCGPGCEKAGLWTGIGKDLVARGDLFVSRDGRTFLSKLHRYEVIDGRRTQLQVVMDLESGEGLSLLLDIDANRRVLPCEFSWSFGRKGGVVYKTVNDLSAELPVAWTPRGWKWMLPFILESQVPVTRCGMEWLGGGRMLHLCPESISGMLEPYSSKMELLEVVRDHAVWESSADEELAVWLEGTVDWQDGEVKAWLSRVRGWAPDGKGIRTIYDHFEARGQLVAMGGGSIAGLTSGSLEDPWPHRFWIGPRLTDESDVPPRMGPDIWSGAMGAEHLTVWGDWIAADPGVVDESFPKGTYERYRSRVVLTRASDWKTRWLGEAEDYQSVFGFALSPTHLYVVPTGRFEKWGTTPELYRYDLSQFENLGEEAP